MKKINVTIIAAFLIALHALLFMLLVKPDKEVFPIKRPATTAQPAVPEATPDEPEIPEFNVPDLQLITDASPRTTPSPKPKPIASVEPVEIVEMPKAETRETIAASGQRAGFLRNDRPVRRTSKVYPKLVGNPYIGSIIVDARTGKILSENRPGAYAYPASITKLMTMLVVLEQIDAGVIRLSDKVAITKEAVGVGGSQVYLDSRESKQFTVDDLLQALVIHSANDAARALAIHTAGSSKAFVDMMNQKARELGMNSTVYHTEHGLPPTDGTQPDISTAYDIALLSLACLKHPETLNYTGTKLAYLPLTALRKERFMLANRNALVGRDPYPGCDGLKTGYHGMGGWSLTATAKRGEDRIIAVVVGAPDKNTRNNSMRKLLDQGFKERSER